MSWFGAHPDIPKALAKAILPARACRVCVYRLRVRTVRMLWYRSGEPFSCPRCGLSWNVFNTRCWVDLVNAGGPVTPSRGRKIPLTRHDYAGDDHPRLVRVLESLPEHVQAKVLGMHDHKGMLTVWWADLGGFSHWHEVEESWDAEGEELGVHRLRQEGLWLRTFGGCDDPYFDVQAPDPLGRRGA